MSVLVTLRELLSGLTLAFAFASFILCIIDVNKQITYFNSYPPAVVAFLVAGACHMLYSLYLVAGSERGRMNKTSIVMSIQGCFLAWYFAIAVSLTVLRWHTHYCPPIEELRLASNCKGITRALIALAWFDFGLLFIWMSIVATLATSYGGFSTALGDLLPAEELEARDVREKSHS